MGKGKVLFFVVWALVVRLYKVFLALTNKERLSIGKLLAFDFYTAVITLVVLTIIVNLF